MSYCVECGVELAEYHEECPLCGTQVNNPNRSMDFSKNDYPLYKSHHVITNRKRVVRRLVGFILTMSFMMAALIPMLIDLKVNGGVTWSVYPFMAALLLWFSIAVPFFKKRNTFFGDFSLSWWGLSIFIFLIDIINTGGFNWSRYVVSSMALAWILLAGIFIPSKIRKYVPVLLICIVSAIGYFLLLASWIADASAVFSLVLPLEGVVLIVFLVSFFLIRSKMHGAINFLILFLWDILVISVSFDLIITHYVLGKYAFTWSFIVILAMVPTIITAFIIKKQIHLKEVIAKKLHR